MIVASWILTVISYIAGAGLIVVGAIFADIFFIILGAIAFLLFGFIGHILVSKKKSNEGSIGKGGMAVYILSFPQFILPFVILFVLLMLLKFLDWVVYIFTDHHYVARFVDYMLSLLLGKPRAFADSDDSDAGEEYLEVIDDWGNHLKLDFIEQKQDYDPDSPYYLKYYKRYRDNLSNYWRSYDGEHVIEEKKIGRQNVGIHT